MMITAFLAMLLMCAFAQQPSPSASGETRTLAAGFFETIEFMAAPNQTQTGICFDVNVMTALAVVSIDVGIMTGAEFARWKSSNFSTDYAFIGGTSCSDVVLCEKAVNVPDRAPVLLVHNTDAVALTVTVKTQAASCRELFTTNPSATTLAQAGDSTASAASPAGGSTTAPSPPSSAAPVLLSVAAVVGATLVVI